MNIKMKISKLLWAASLMALGSLPTTQAQEPPSTTPAVERTGLRGALGQHIYLSPMFSYTFASGHRDTKNGIGGAFSIGREVVPDLYAEVSVFYTRYESDSGSGSSSILAGGLSLLAFPFAAVPNLFGVAGFHYGYGRSSLPAVAPMNGQPQQAKQDSNRGTVDLGLGYLIGPIGFLNNGGLRLEARGRLDQVPAGPVKRFIEPVLSAGLLIPIGSAEPPAAPVAVAQVVPVAVDTDGDGVYDDSDQCPGTPPGTKVDAVGCPLAVPPPLVKLICDDPAARKGKVLSLAGCGQGDKIVLKGVNFDFDKSTLTAKATTILDDVASGMGDWQQVLIELGGYTDSRGSDAYNQKLSEARVKSVQVYLGGKGITEDRISAKGFGEVNPVASNDTDEGRELNRRVELTILGAGDGTAVSTADAAPVEGAGETDAGATPEVLAPEEAATDPAIVP